MNITLEDMAKVEVPRVDFGSIHAAIKSVSPNQWSAFFQHLRIQQAIKLLSSGTNISEARKTIAGLQIVEGLFLQVCK